MQLRFAAETIDAPADRTCRAATSERSEHGIRYPDRRRRGGYPRTGRRHPAGRGPRHAHRARQRRGAGRRRGAPAQSGVPRYLAAGQPARRPATARHPQAGASRTADRDDLGPRQYRDRGFGDQARRLRLHREAVQGRPAGAGRRPRAGELAAQARGAGAQATRARCRRRWSAVRPPINQLRQTDREGGADQQPHPHRRPVGQRQGARRAHHSRAVRPAPTGRSW